MNFWFLIGTIMLVGGLVILALDATYDGWERPASLVNRNLLLAGTLAMLVFLVFFRVESELKEMSGAAEFDKLFGEIKKHLGPGGSAGLEGPRNWSECQKHARYLLVQAALKKIKLEKTDDDPLGTSTSKAAADFREMYRTFEDGGLVEGGYEPFFKEAETPRRGGSGSGIS
ncbi:MAG: hypothetical protein AAB864_01785 [Patescibacteria group bacterium]